MLALSPEHEVVLLGARPSLDDEARSRLDELISAGVDWSEVQATADRHGVLPVVAAAVRGHASLPPSAARRLAEQTREIAARNLQMTQELLAVLGALESVGVEAATFKGPALAVELYGSIALRQFTDIDVLIGESDRDRAVDVLSRRGYRPFDATTDRESAVLISVNAHVALFHPRLLVRLEVHTHLAAPHLRFHLTAVAALSRTRLIHIGGTAVRTLASSDLALYLCVHGTKHEWERLEWLSDLARLVERDSGVDWLALIDSAGGLGHERAVLLGLALCDSLWRVTPSPEIGLPGERDRLVSHLVSQVERALFQPEMPLWKVRTISFQLSRRGDKTRQLLFRLFRPQLTDLRALALPAQLYFLYYALRPLRVTRTRLPGVARRVLSSYKLVAVDAARRAIGVAESRRNRVRVSERAHPVRAGRPREGDR